MVHKSRCCWESVREGNAVGKLVTFMAAIGIVQAIGSSVSMVCRWAGLQVFSLRIVWYLLLHACRMWDIRAGLGCGPGRSSQLSGCLALGTHD